MNGNPTVVFSEPCKVVIEDRDIPSPGEGEVLVRSSRTLISTGTELTVLEGKFPSGSAWEKYGGLPCVPGYDNIGEIVDVGTGVDGSRVGETVCSYGTHSAYAVVPADNAQCISRDIANDHAVFFTIAHIVMNGVRASGITWGESAVIYGQGLLGQFCTRFCRIAGAKPLFAVDMSDYRLGLLPEVPGIVKVNPSGKEVPAAVLEGNRDRKADVVFEVTGVAGLIPSELASLRQLGRFVILSSPCGVTEFDFHDLCNSPSFRIIGAHNSSHPEVATPNNQWTKARDNEMFFDLVADGELDVEPLISHREKWSSAPELYGMLMADRSKAMGVVLDWSE